ncbi:MAG: transposase, partial [Phycisphaerales bacterium]|nr:transposase [Phycisphaerales bacterium]
VHACSIMPDHVHLVVCRGARIIEQIAGHLKSFATRQLNDEGIHPLANFRKNGETPSIWARGTRWTRYLNSIDDMVRSIKYVEDNPAKDGLPRQHWNFVTPYAAASRV